MNAALSFICVLGCALGMLLIAALLTQHKRSHANLLLACLIAVVCIDVLFSAAEHLSQQATANALSRLISFPGLLFAPLLYLYFAAERSGHLWRKADMWHAASFVLLQSMAIFIFATPAAVRLGSAEAYLNLACVPVIGAYMIAIVRMPIMAGERGSIFQYPELARIALLVALGSYFLRAPGGVLIPQLNAAAENIWDAVLCCSLAMLACSAKYRVASRDPETVSTQPAILEEAPERKKAKYGNNRLPDFLRASIIAELNRHMRSAQPWLKVDLTLSQLAASINVNPHHLSQIINSEFGKSFACYINEHRVTAACQLLLDKSSKAVLDVALNSGFSSKSSFNALFKKHTGMTPSEYRRRFQKSDSLVA
jgi:AraC-like DNA-binding protein